MALSASEAARPQLFICSLLDADQLLQDLSQFLNTEFVHIVSADSNSKFLEILEQRKHQIDCLLLPGGPQLSQITDYLHQQAIVLPAIVIEVEAESATTPQTPLPQPAYHQAELRVRPSQLLAQDHPAGSSGLTTAPKPVLGMLIERAINQFLKLNPACRLDTALKPLAPLQADPAVQTFVTMQQRRLSEKLKERLGYLGIYYRRDPKAFLRHLPAAEKQEFLDDLKVEYRQIVLNYFRRDQRLNEKIDNYVNKAFFADVSVSQVLEIHMELMDAFAKQLKLEGRNEDILLDYRLTLIDIIAHLCEMYRRSVPRES